jgi:protein-disulfide isomerase
VGALVVVAVVLALVLSGGKSSGLPKNAVAVGSLTNALPGASDVAANLKGIPQTGTTLGWPSAPVTMVEYIDVQCPICRQFETQVFPDILQKYVRTKRVKVIVKSWAFIGPDSVRGQDAMLAAARQDKAFNFAQVLYDNQGTENTGWLDDRMVYAIAASVPGMKVRQLFDERNSSTVKNAASSIATDAKANNVTGTPSIFVGKAGTTPKYVALSGGTDEPTLVKALDVALAS